MKDFIFMAAAVLFFELGAALEILASGFNRRIIDEQRVLRRSFYAHIKGVK